MNNDVVSIITIDSLLQLVATVTPVDGGYMLNRPLRVFRNVTPSEKGTTLESYALVTWIPFTSTEDFFVKEEKIINISEMAESFSFDYYRVADGVYSETEKNDFWDEEEDELSVEEFLDYQEAKRNNKIN